MRIDFNDIDSMTFPGMNEALPGFFLFRFSSGIPCPQAQEAQHVHFVDLLHAPAVFHQLIVGGINIFRQRQGS